MSIDYGSILTRAWRITWNHKVLWIFGILASLAGGGGGGGNTGFRTQRGEDLPPQLERMLDRVDPGVLIAVVVALACLGLLVVVVLIALSVIGRGGLIGGVQLVEANDRVTFGEAWAVGVRHFWTLFLIGLAVGLVTFLLFILTIVPGVLLTALTFGLGLICLLPLICLLAVVAIILSVIAYLAQIAAVVENLGVTAALSRAWEVIQANLGSIIVLGIILLLVGGVVGFVIALPVVAVVFPPLIGLATGDESGLRVGIVVAVLCFLAYLPVLLVLSGILQTWITAAWTLAYQQFTRPAAAPGMQAPPPPVAA
jgi:hypothetical protein